MRPMTLGGLTGRRPGCDCTAIGSSVRGFLIVLAFLGSAGFLPRSVLVAESGGRQAPEARVAPTAPLPERFEPLLRHSPFQRVLKPEETFELRGVARFDTHAVATLYNRQTGETVQVRGGEARDGSLPSDGPRLVEVHEGGDLGEVSVRIAMGGQEVELKYDPRRVTPPVREAPRYEVKHDSRGRPIPPKALIEKYRSMNDEERKRYMRWREGYYEKRPELKDSAERFPIVDRAIDAIKAGKEPPRP